MLDEHTGSITFEHRLSSIMLKGINIIPDRIGDILQQVRGERPVFQLAAVCNGRQDQLEIKEMTTASPSFRRRF